MRHLEAASQASGVKVNLEWLPFLLNPEMSDEGEPVEEYLLNKYGPAAKQRFNDPNSHLRQMGRKVGIEFTNSRNVVNTRRVHALMEELKGRDNDKANRFMADLYKRYFENGENINDTNLLVDIVKKYGLKEDEAKAAMEEEKLENVTKLDFSTKMKYGVSGVPFFMVHPSDGGRPVAFSGAYPVEIIAEQLEEASSA